MSVMVFDLVQCVQLQPELSLLQCMSSLTGHLLGIEKVIIDSEALSFKISCQALDPRKVLAHSNLDSDSLAYRNGTDAQDSQVQY
jgi:hypothetical protein